MRAIVPMLLELRREPPAGSNWAFEIKWDGFVYRAVLFLGRPGVRVQSRNLRDLTALFPEVAPLAEAIGRHAVLDGEIVAPDEKGIPDFDLLRDRAITRRGQPVARSTPIAFMAFDLLELGRRTLIEVPYSERRRVLEDLDLHGPNWATPGNYLGDGARLLDETRKLGLEGIVAIPQTCSHRPCSSRLAGFHCRSCRLSPLFQTVSCQIRD